MKTIRRFTNGAEASFCCSLLEAAGIEATLVDENTFTMGPQYVPWGIRLQVADESSEEALAVLDKQAGFEPLPDDFVPPPAEPEPAPYAGKTLSAGAAFVRGGLWTCGILAFLAVATQSSRGIHFHVNEFSLVIAFFTGGFLRLLARLL